MKKLVLTLGAAAMLLVSSQAQAFDLGGYTGELLFDFQNWDTGVTYDADSSGSNLADGQADSFGLLKIIAITDFDGNVLWAQGQDGEYLEGWFYGIDDNAYELDAQGVGTIDSIGGVVELYLNTANNLAQGNAAPTVPFADLNPPADTWQATDGELFLSLNFTPGILSPVGDLTTTYHQDVTSITDPTTGHGEGYLSVTGGEFAYLFNGNTYDSVFPGADFYFQNEFNSANLGTKARAAGWLVKSDGTATGDAVVPEPASMMLLGSGLLGMVGFRRNKKS